MIVTDNFLEASEFDFLRTEIFSDKFPWIYCSVKSTDNDKNINDFANQQMCHMHNGNETSDSVKLLLPLLQILKPLALLKVKSNLQFGTSEIYQSPFHIDMENIPNNVCFKTCVYYLNTNNGYTIFEDTNEIVESVENRMVIFDGRRRHAGTTCTDNKTRAVINLNFIPSNETEYGEKL